jgi:hypothetical protein
MSVTDATEIGVPIDVGAGSKGFVVFAAFDATCENRSMEPAQEGSVTLTSHDATHFAGTYDLTFPEGRVTGTFDAPACALGTPQTDSCD